VHYGISFPVSLSGVRPTQSSIKERAGQAAHFKDVSVVQNDAEKRAMYLEAAVAMNESRLAEAILEGIFSRMSDTDIKLSLFPFATISKFSKLTFFKMPCLISHRLSMKGIYGTHRNEK